MASKSKLLHTKSFVSAVVVALVVIVAFISTSHSNRKVTESLVLPEGKNLPNHRRTKQSIGPSIITKDDKIAVIHVGPRKTGTTTLQEFLFLQAESVNALKRDNYAVPFLGTTFGDAFHSRQILSNCLKIDTSNTDQCVAILEYFQSFVNDSAMHGSNILFSSEGLSNPKLNIAKMTSYLIPQYKIHIVLYYRRFYDWLHSQFNQLIKHSYNKKHTAPCRPGERKKHRDRKLAIRHITFVEWLTDHELSKQLQLYSISVYNRLHQAPGIFNVSVVNMHEDPDNFDTNVKFTCDYMDNAPHLCEVAKSYEARQSNPSIDPAWKLFRSRVENSISLSCSDERWGKVEAKFYEMTDIPQACLSPELQNKILQISLESESALTPEWWYNSTEGLENLKYDFEGKINSTLCSMDINAILTSPEWEKFFMELEDDQVNENY